MPKKGYFNILISLVLFLVLTNSALAQSTSAEATPKANIVDTSEPSSTVGSMTAAVGEEKEKKTVSVYKLSESAKELLKTNFSQPQIMQIDNFNNIFNNVKNKSLSLGERNTKILNKIETLIKTQAPSGFSTKEHDDSLSKIILANEDIIEKTTNLNINVIFDEKLDMTTLKNEIENIKEEFSLIKNSYKKVKSDMLVLINSL